MATSPAADIAAMQDSDPVASLESAADFDVWFESLTKSVRQVNLMRLLEKKRHPYNVANSGPSKNPFVTPRKMDNDPKSKTNNETMEVIEISDDELDDEQQGCRWVSNLIKSSTQVFHGEMMKLGWNRYAENPRADLEAIIRVIRATGRPMELVKELSNLERGDFPSTAAYQHRLVTIRRSLVNLECCDDNMVIIMAINGLRKVKTIWYNKLVQEFAMGQVSWSTLNAQMASKALGEATPKKPAARQTPSD